MLDFIQCQETLSVSGNKHNLINLYTSMQYVHLEDKLNSHSSYFYNNKPVSWFINLLNAGNDKLLVEFSSKTY